MIKKNNGKYILNKLKENKRDKIIRKIINNHGISYDDIINSYFKKWKYINKRLEQINNANIIQKFCLIKLRKRINIIRWKKLYSLLKHRNKRNNIRDILKLLKNYLSIIKLSKALKGNNKRNIFDKKFYSYFLNRLKHLKRFGTSVENLKIIITKQDNINKNIILRNIINKWRNIVADYEIEKLKGKLLLKIYDKYKTFKIKDVLKKILTKWENNTIFLDKIKNKINKENTDRFAIKNKKDKIMILIKSIIRNINRKNNDIILRKYLNIWKKNIQDRNKILDTASLYILKIIKINIGKYILNKLKDNKKDKILKNIFIKYARLRPNEEIINSYFARWRYITKKLVQINNANIIQRFCKINLRKREVQNKWKKLYLLLKKKKRRNDIKDMIKGIKKYINIIKFTKILKGNNKRNIFDKKFIAYFFNKLNRIKEQSSSYQILKRIIIKQNNKKKYILLKNIINKWRNIVADYKIGKLKGKLLTQMYDKYKTSKIKEIIKRKIKIWENNTIFLDKIKNKINKENTDIFKKKNIKDKVTILMRTLIRNINRKNNDNILRKYLNKWKEKTQDKNKRLGSLIMNLKKIIKKNYGKYIFKKLKDNKRDNILRKIIIKNGRSKYDIINSYFSKWKYINKILKQINNAKTIQKFCQIKLRKRANIYKWKKLYSSLKNKNEKKNIKDILKLLKYYIGIRKLTNKLKINNKKNILDIIKNQKDTKKITIIILKIFEKNKIKSNNILLKRYFSKWKNNIRKKNKKEEALDKMMKMLELKKMKSSINNLGVVSLIVKLLKDITKVRALYFIRKIKEKGKLNNLYTNLSNDLINTNEEFIKIKRNPLINQIIKIYAYKVLSKFFNCLDKVRKNNSLSEMEDFFLKLYQININKKKKKYRKTNKYQKNPNIKKGMKLHITIKPKTKRDEKDNKFTVYKELTPFLVKYLNKIFKNHKKNIFDAIKYNTVGLGDKFSKLLKIFSKKTQIPDKEDLVDSLKYYVYMKLIKVSSADKFYYLIRKAIIRKILNISKATGNLNRILHLIKITMTHRDISTDRWILRLIKKWRFITFVRKMAMKKMELMYKDLHVTYLEMADSVLNEGSPLGPNGANFLHNINKDKYAFEFYDPYLIKGAKPYKAIKKEYVFEPIDNEIEKTVKIIEETKTMDRMRKANKNYYDYDYDSNFSKTEIKKVKIERENKPFAKGKRNVYDNNNKDIEGKVPVQGKKVVVKKIRVSNNVPVKGDERVPINKGIRMLKNNQLKDIQNNELENSNGEQRVKNNDEKNNKKIKGKKVKVIKRKISNDIERKDSKNSNSISKNIELEDLKNSGLGYSKNNEIWGFKNIKGNVSKTNNEVRTSKNGELWGSNNNELKNPNNNTSQNGGRIIIQNDFEYEYEFVGKESDKDKKKNKQELGIEKEKNLEKKYEE